MALQTLTLKNIQSICNSAAGQAEVAKFAQTMNEQGVMKFFIDYAKVRDLISRMVKEGIMKEETPMENYSDENFTKEFIVYSTNKMIDYLSRVSGIESKSIMHGLPMLREMATIYLVGPYRPMMVFYWMSEFAIPFKEELTRIIQHYFTFVRFNPDKFDMYMQLIEDAVPLGINPDVQALAWVRANEEEYRKLDFSEIFAAIPFDRYYEETFDKDVREDRPSPQFGTRFMILPKDEIKRLADEAFKPLVLNEVFPELKSLDTECINEGIKKFFKERPTMVYMLYSRAMFFTKVSELNRLQKEFMKFFDEQGIEYTLESTGPVNPMMLKDMPWSGNPS